MNTKTILTIVAVLVIAGLGYFLLIAPPQQGITEAPTEESGAAGDSSGAPAMGKLNIDAVCEGALAYMTFPDGDAAAKFVAECKAGEHPEVIEKYKADMNLGEGAAI